MSSPLASTPSDSSPQNHEDVTPESEKKHPVTSSISSLLNNTKPLDGTHAKTTSTPSSPKLTVTSPPLSHCGAPEQQQQQQLRKRPFSALDKGAELSISTTDNTRSLSLSQYSLDAPQQQQQHPVWPAGNHHQHYHHHLPTPVSPAAPMPQPSPGGAEVDLPPQLKGETNENNDHHRHHLTPSRSKPETSTGMYTSFSVKQSSSAHTNSDNNIISSATTPTAALSPSVSSPLNTRSPHENTPTTSKPYTCTECDQTFSRAHNLKSHTATHSLERPYKCESCQAKFRRLHDLKRHQKLHTGERPYICNMCQRSFSRLDALNRHQRTEGGSACHYRQNRRRTDQKHSDEESSSPPPAPVSALGVDDRHSASPQQLPSTPSVSSPPSALATASGSFSPISVAPSTIQQQQQQAQILPQRPAPSRPSIPQLNLRHRFTSPYHPEDSSAPQPLVFRSTPTSTPSIGDNSPHEPTRRIVLPPPSNSTPTSSTPTQPTQSHLNAFPLHPPPPTSGSSPSRSSYPLPALPSPLQGVQPDRIRRRRQRSSGAGSEHASTDMILSPGSFNGPESYPALRTAYMQLLEQYRGLQTTINHGPDSTLEQVETLKRKVHDLQVENRVLRSLVFERQQ